MKFRIRFAEQLAGPFILVAISGFGAALVLQGVNQCRFALNYSFWIRLASAESYRRLQAELEGK
jgi:hypothetical protein